MSLITKVKINSVKDLSTARLAAGSMVNMIGFNLDAQSVEYIGAEKIMEINSWLSGIEIVAECGNLAPELAMELSEAVDPDFIQSSHPEIMSSDINKKIIFEMQAGDEQFIDQVNDTKNVQLVLAVSFDKKDPKAFEEWLCKINKPILLSFGISKENVRELIELPNINGIAISGGQEVATGEFSGDDMIDVLEKLED